MLSASKGKRMHAYIVVSLLTGARTEELRALLWDEVHLARQGEVPAHIAVVAIRSQGRRHEDPDVIQSGAVVMDKIFER